jgi:hypothetical protein
MSNTETDPESNSSSEQDSSSSVPIRYSIIAAVGVIGTREDVKEFADQFIVAVDEAAKQINEHILEGRLQLLPPDEGDFEPEVH